MSFVSNDPDPMYLCLPKEDLQIVFDVAVESMDFASGFLDNDEVLGLQRVARVLGVDPMKATPSNFDQVVAECEHDWEYADRTWRVNPGCTVGHGDRHWGAGEEIPPEFGADVRSLARQGIVSGPTHGWWRRCRKCLTHEQVPD